MVWETFVRAGWTAILDILLVAFIIYEFLMIIKGTRAQQLAIGVCVLLLVWAATQHAHLYAFNWLVGRVLLPYGAIALIILFQPEIRLALEQLGRGRLLRRGGPMARMKNIPHLVNELVEAATDLAMRKIGALMVLERETALGDIIATGKEIHGYASAELLKTVFFPNTPLHDGAAVISGDILVAAGCLLPLTERQDLSPSLGTRHRAALGLAERTDAVIIVVSEETGIISLACNGELRRDLTEEALKERLLILLQPAGTSLLSSQR
ncbi:MAG TPA: TIGR00159 family protein [Armatimonadetes bacterium]|nr:TIGR00159 family protein [Armatimonadota bacterium]